MDSVIWTCAGIRMHYERALEFEKHMPHVKVHMADICPRYGWLKLPRPIDSSYVDELMKHCKELQSVAAVFVASDLEVEVLEPYVQDFKAIGVDLIMGQGLGWMSNKASFYSNYPRPGGVPSRAPFVFEQHRSAEELCFRVSVMAYGTGSAVVKPSKSSGSRSTWLVKPYVDFYARRDSSISYNAFRGALPKGLLDEPYIVMEELKGDHFTVGVLCDQGIPKLIVPMLKMAGDISGSVGSAMLSVTNRMVIEMTELFCRTYSPHGVFSLEMAQDDETGLPMIYDVNPRISLDMGHYDTFGFSMLAEAYKLFKGQELGVDTIDLVNMSGRISHRRVVVEGVLA